MKVAAVDMCKLGAKGVLIKGGHLEDESTDLLYNGKEFFIFKQKKIKTKNTHGTGCTLSSAIAANLANGMDMNKSVSKAKEYITGAIKNSFDVGHGNGPTNHFYNAGVFW